jgi:hypothetical protein
MSEIQNLPAEIDSGRVERGVQLECDPIGDGRYRVTGGDSDHWVDLVSRDHPRCDCGDYLWRDVICKHIVAAMLREGDERMLFRVGEVVRALSESNKEKERELKRATAA